MRYEGPVKGYIVLVNDDTGESTLHIVEPLHMSKEIYDAMNTNYGKLTVQFGIDATFPNILYGTPASDLSRISKKIGTADGSTTSFSGSFGSKVVPGSVKVTVNGVEVAADDGNGNLIGDGYTGTVAYDTGDVSVTASTAPASGDVVISGIVVG